MFGETVAKVDNGATCGARLSCCPHFSCCLNALGGAGIRCPITLGRLNMFIQAIVVAAVALCVEEHHGLYTQMLDAGWEPTASTCSHSFIIHEVHSSFEALECS